MASLAKVPPKHTAPELQDAPEGLPEECPRCGVSLEHALREVKLVLFLDDGAEVEHDGHECAACGWCCTPGLDDRGAPF